MSYQVSYRYESPSPAGPFKGKTVVDVKPTKGDRFHAIFGIAIVTSFRKVKECLATTVSGKPLRQCDKYPACICGGPEGFELSRQEKQT